MGKVYVLGGLGESVLARNQNGSREVWLDPSVIMLGKFIELALAPNGVSPRDPDGVQLYATSAIGPYVGFPSQILRVQLLAYGFDTVTHWWDWRKSIYAAGIALAYRIRAEASAADPCSIVAHSAGGIVARAAWTELGLSGEQSLVRRIVTCGTPHWGSYTIVEFWSGASPTIDLITYWNQTVGYNTAGWSPEVTGYQYVTVPEIQQLGMTWPSMYDLLPTLGAPEATDDPHRADLYVATNWPAAARPSQVWLDYSRDVTGPWLRSAASQPPSHILTCTGGRAQNVARALTSPGQLGDVAALGNYGPGDEAVSVGSALLATGTNFTYSINHENLLPNLANNGELGELVRDEREPGPAPPVQVETEIQTTNVQPLPFPEGINGGGALVPCITGQCAC